MQSGIRGAAPEIAAQDDRHRYVESQIEYRQREIERRGREFELFKQMYAEASVNGNTAQCNHIQQTYFDRMEHYELMDRLDAIANSSEQARFDEQRRWFADRQQP